MQPDPPKVRKLLKPADRRLEILIGWLCALISLAFTALFVFILYLVAWRNPRQYGTRDFFKLDTLAFLAVVLLIAMGFSIFATRLLRKKKSGQRLMSPFVLRIWGAFFSAGGVVVLIDCIIHHRWKQLPHLWEVMVTSFSMAAAAFALASVSETKNDSVHVSPLTRNKPF